MRKILSIGLLATVLLFASFANDNSFFCKIPQSERDSLPSVKMYNCIMKYSDMYEIPSDYAFGVAYEESRYKGPGDIHYKQSVQSPHGALGPMQMKLSTAKAFVDSNEKITKKSLISDIDLNVRLSMRYLRSLKDRYGTWGKALGAYNTGRPVINQYSKRILKKSYNWVSVL